MKYEEWIKYEEERLRQKEMQKPEARIKVNERALSSLTLDEILALMRAWVAAQPARARSISEPPAQQPVASTGARAI